MNCRNCGAPINPNQTACAYCNTAYYFEGRDRFDIDYNQRLEIERFRKLNDRYANVRNVQDMYSRAGQAMNMYGHSFNEIRQYVLYADDKPVMTVFQED